MGVLSKAIDSMETVLEAEATALRNGALDQLAQIERAKRKAWASIQIARPDNDVRNLSRIQSLAAHNARLLLAAKDGIVAASAIRTSVLKGPKPLSTYGANGQKSTVLIESRDSKNSRSF